MKQTFRYFTKRAGRLNVRAVTWFSWMDSRTRICACATSGLFTQRLAPKRSWDAFTRFTGSS